MNTLQAPRVPRAIPRSFPPSISKLMEPISVSFSTRARKTRDHYILTSSHAALSESTINGKKIRLDFKIYTCIPGSGSFSSIPVHLLVTGFYDGTSIVDGEYVLDRKETEYVADSGDFSILSAMKKHRFVLALFTRNMSFFCDRYFIYSPSMLVKYLYSRELINDSGNDIDDPLLVSNIAEHFDVRIYISTKNSRLIYNHKSHGDLLQANLTEWEHEKEIR